jgi:hypothetical protein
MKKRLFIIAASLALLSIPGGLVWADQLDGIQMKQAGDKVQVILDMDKATGYRVEGTGTGVDIVLPKATLPAAFEGTGLPPIKSPETGVTANVQESGDGVRIHLSHSSKNRHLPYAIRFQTAAQTTANKSTVLHGLSLAKAQVSPTKTQAVVLPTPAPKVIEKKIPTVAKKPAVSAPKTTIASRPRKFVPTQHPPVAYKVVHAVPILVAKVAKAPEKPKVETSTPPKSTMIAQADNPKANETKADTKVDGFSMMERMQQPIEEKPQATTAEKVLSPQTVSPQTQTQDNLSAEKHFNNPRFMSRFAPSPLGNEFSTQDRRTLPLGHHSLFNHAGLQWLFTACALLGALVLGMVSLLVFARWRSRRYKMPLAEVPQESPFQREYFEEPSTSVGVVYPQHETYEELLAQEGLQTQQSPFVPRIPSESLLMGTTSSLSEAICNGLAPQSSSYSSVPFKITAKSLHTTAGGPKPKQPAPLSSESPKSSFSSHLKN